ncbi:MAG: hypothetical protein FWB93_02400 [Oscillospiraceae bacterium]|nr:hypothetical protein [Oscillospiraceae bacterium]
MHKILIFTFMLFSLLLIGCDNTTNIAPPYYPLNGNDDQQQPLDPARIIRDSVPQSARVVDIAMLGAHNSFSHAIDRSSPIDPNDTSFVASNPLLLAVGGDIIAGFARTQAHGAGEMLERGVRYFDVRITYAEGWYTENTLISAPLREYIAETIAFLQDNPGELVIFDIYEVRLGGSANFTALWSYVGEIMVNGQSLFDFVHITPQDTPLHTVTLADATVGGTAGGVIIFARTAATQGGHHYPWSGNLRRVWHNQQETAGIIARMSGEHEYLGGGRHDNVLRVGQAQLSPILEGEGLASALLSGSYIAINSAHNAEILLYEGLSDWLTTMPILMFGAVTYDQEFTRQILEIMSEFNRGLE